MDKTPKEAIIADLDDIEAVPCPCGKARRALMTEDNGLCSLHRVEISANAKAHYHKALTETYYVLEGEGWIELNGQRKPLSPGMAVLIPPEIRHRAVIEEGRKMTILNFVMPPFDPADEYL